MKELHSELSSVSIIDSLLAAIDSETRAYLEDGNEAKITVKMPAPKQKEKETAEKTNLPPSKDNPSAESIISPRDNVQENSHKAVKFNEVSNTSVEPPVQHSSEIPDTASTMSESLESTEDIYECETGEEEEGEEEGEEEDEDEDEDDGDSEDVPQQELEDGTTSNESTPTSSPASTPPIPRRGVTLEGDGTKEDTPAHTGWKSYKKTATEEAPEYNKARRERRDKRKSINFSNNNVHIPCQKTGVIRSLYRDVQKLLDEKAVLQEQLGWTYPQQYRKYSMYEEVKKRDKTLGEPPNGVPIDKYLLDERKTILRDILFLTSLLEIMEENKSFRSQIAGLEKQVETMFAEVKVLESTKDMLQKSKAK